MEKGFLDGNGAIQATARVVADFPTYKPCSMGGNKKLKREAKRESKTSVKEDGKEVVIVVHSILGEVLDEVIAWGWGDALEEDLSSSTEEEEEDLSGGDYVESESSENISDGELEWLAKDLREVLALPENKSARPNRGVAKARGSRRVLKEGLSLVQQELEQRRRGRKRLKSGISGRYQRPGYTPMQVDAFLGVRRLLSFKALDSYDEEDDEDYTQPEDYEILHVEDDKESDVQSASAVTMKAPMSVEQGGAAVEEIAKKCGKWLGEIKDHEERGMLARCLTETLTHCGTIFEEGGEEFKVEKVVAGWKINVESKKAIEATEEIIVDELKEDEECSSRVTEDIVVAELDEIVDPELLSPQYGESGEEDNLEKSLEEVEDQKEREIRAPEAFTKTIDVKNLSKEWKGSVQTDFDEVVVENVAESAPSKPAIKSKLVHISPAKPALITIFEEDESDLEVRKEIAGDNWELGEREAVLEEDPGVEPRCVETNSSLSRYVDLQMVKDSIKSPAQHMLGVEHGEDGSSVVNFSNPEHWEDQHLEEVGENDEPGEHGDNTVSQNQTASRTLPDEVLSGLRGLDGAILLLQKARLDLLRQV